MLEIQVNAAGGIEKALKLLKRKFTKAGVVKELRNRQAYTKPSIERRNEILRAAYTQAYRAREEQRED
jgi:small subunit ribosomal protein S21